MKLADLKNPVTGSHISLSPGNIISMVLGGVVLMGIWRLSQAGFARAVSYAPGPLGSWLGGPTVAPNNNATNTKTQAAPAGPVYRVHG